MYHVCRICLVISNSMNAYMYSSITGTVIGLSFRYFHQKKSFVQTIVCRGNWLIKYMPIYEMSEVSLFIFRINIEIVLMFLNQSIEKWSIKPDTAFHTQYPISFVLLLKNVKPSIRRINANTENIPI